MARADALSGTLLMALCVRISFLLVEDRWRR
jgi:hypothetical protein